MPETASLTDSSPDILCLSIPTSLRCANLTHLQSFAIFLPSILELLVALNYIRIVITSRVGKGGSRWKEWRMLLPAESFIFFLLALVDYIIHVVAVDHSGSGESVFIREFRSVDMAIGVLSGLPIILYTLFLTAFTASVLTTFLVIPIKSILLFLIPVIVVLNGFASLAGVTYTSPLKSPIPDPDPDPTVLAIGFTSDFAFRVSEVLTTSALFPLIFFQALCAFFCFYPAKNPDGHLEIGIVLGAVETLIGLGNTGLNNLILRRGMRFLARTFIFAGLLRMRANANGIGPFSIIDSPGKSISRPLPVDPDGPRLSGVENIGSVKRPAPTFAVERGTVLPPARRSSNYLLPRDDNRSTVEAGKDIDIEKIAGRSLEGDSRGNMDDIEKRLAVMLEQGEKETMETKHGRTKTVSRVISAWYKG